MWSESELERDRHESRLKFRRDRAAILTEASDQGFAEGLAESKKCASLIGRIRVCRRLLQKPATPDAPLWSEPLHVLTRLAAELEAEVAPLFPHAFQPAEITPTPTDPAAPAASTPADSAAPGA